MILPQIQLTNATFSFKYAKNLLTGDSNSSFSLGLLLILYCIFLIYSPSYRSNDFPFGTSSPVVNGWAILPLDQEQSNYVALT